MIEVFATGYAVTNGANIAFANKALQTGITATIDSTNTAIQLNKPGIYQVVFSASGASTADGTIGAQLVANGAAVPRAVSTTTTAAGDPQAIGFNTLVAVGPSVATETAYISVNYTGSAGTLTVADLVVTKIA